MEEHGDVRAVLRDAGLPESDGEGARGSHARFPDGAAYRIEIPSTEGVSATRAVLAAADEHGVRIDRISQGSGIFMCTDAELDELAAIGAAEEVEVCLFTGPRAAWDTGRSVLSAGGAVQGASLRGISGLAAGIDDVIRACEHGIRSVLVADLGQLRLLARMRSAGDVPADLILKTSVSIAPTNPATARLLEDLGADTINASTDLTIEQLGSMREAVDVPLDVYVEVPDDFGGSVRHHEVAAIVRACAPVYLKFGLRNLQVLYPSGAHLEAVAVAAARERVRRAAIGLTYLARHGGAGGPAAGAAAGATSNRGGAGRQ
jgi:hypothetical protein